MTFSITWNVDADGDWATAANWSPVRAPKSSDNVGIDTLDFHTITLSSGSRSVHSLVVGNDDFAISGASLVLAAPSSFAHAVTLTNGRLTLAGGGTVSGLFTANDGSVLFAGGGVTLAGGAAFSGTTMIKGKGVTILQGATTLGSASHLDLDNRKTLENQGVFTESGNSVIVLGHNPFGSTSGAATLKNDLGATLIFDNDAFVVAVAAGSGTKSFINAGAVQHVGVGETKIDVPFTNTGTVLVSAGQLDVHGLMTGGGTVTVQGGAAFVLDAATTHLANQVHIADGGGLFHLTTGAGNDTLVIGNGLQAADSINGGGGTDTVTLSGDYSGGVTFAASTMTNVEKLVFAAGFDYDLTADDATVASGKLLRIDASALGAADGLTFNGAAETDGKFDITGGAGADVLTGGGKGDVFRLEAGGDDTASGGAGQETFLMGAALTSNDRIDGGADQDVVKLAGDYSAGLVFTATTMTNVEVLSLASGFGYDLTTDDATVGAGQMLTVDASALGSARSLTFNGAAETDGTFDITGGAGADVLTGGAQADSFHVSAGADTVHAGGGDDSIFMGDGLTAADQIDGGDGADTVRLNGHYGGDGRVVMTATTMVNVETLVVGFNKEVIAYDLTTADATVAAGQTLTVDATELTDDPHGSSPVLLFNGAAETDGSFNVAGGDNADHITTGAGADILIGGKGDDVLDGGGGADQMSGGMGSDIYYVDNPGDVVTEIPLNSFLDEVRTTLSTYTLPVDVERLTYTGSGDFTGFGNSGENIITGGAGADSLDGGAGFRDTLVGGDGDDTYVVHNTNDIVTEGVGKGTDTVQSLAAVYTLSSNVENLTYTGAGAFTGTGNGLANTITGGDGADVLKGAAGADTLTGGGGADHFVFAGASESTGATYDTITDFDAASDRIDLSVAIHVIDPALTAGALSTASFDGDLMAALGAGQLVSHTAVEFTPDSGTLAGEHFLVVDLNGTAGYQAGADLVIHLLGSYGTLTPADFI